jgi:hypothetical protein
MMLSGGSTAVSPRLIAALHIRISHPDALPDLVSALSKRAHFVVGAVGTDLVTVGVLGSFADGGKGDMKRFLRAWTTEHPGIETVIEIDDLRAVAVLPIPLPRPDINDAFCADS